MDIALIAVQFLHVLFGAILIGSAVYMHFVLWPGILSRPSAEARAFYEGILKKTSVLMASSGGITFLLGILRGTLLGPIHSLSDLGSPYGITFSIALFATLAMLIQGPRIGPTLLKKVWNGNAFSPEAARTVKVMNLVPLLAILVILACMVLMHFSY